MALASYGKEPTHRFLVGTSIIEQRTSSSLQKASNPKGGSGLLLVSHAIRSAQDTGAEVASTASDPSWIEPSVIGGQKPRSPPRWSWPVGRLGSVLGYHRLWLAETIHRNPK
jgi:hypothetical protein